LATPLLGLGLLLGIHPVSAQEDSDETSPAQAETQDEESAMAEGRNRLAQESSPYLLQHKDNPVWWYPWGDAAFEAAKRRDVPIFLSVGYSTCHWCHVMEHESFEDEQVASLLNDHYVAIKVDREERPDVDAIYMDAVQALTRQGGWPMSVFLTPDGKPFFAGTYFPKETFVEVLRKVTEIWNQRRDQLLADAQRLAEALESQAERGHAGSLGTEDLQRFLEVWKANFDPVHGGLAGAPKFPQADDLRLLLRIHRRGDAEPALEMVTKTLDAMAAGGIYDHLGGGFARYSTDDRWLVPHFEKMLYDQAQLVLAYLEGWQVTGNEEYPLVVRETLDYVLRDMTHTRGAFYSAEDADSEGVEGKFYVWSFEELTERLDEEQLKLVRKAFGVSPAGNFEGNNILALQPGHSRVERSEELEKAMNELFEARSQRVRPHLDDKILTDWNALMITAFARAGRVLDETRYVEAATKAARFLLDEMRNDEGELLHRWREGEAGIRAFLEDYAYLIHALLELYQTDFDPAWLSAAQELQALQDGLFRNEGSGEYHTTDGRDDTVLYRRTEYMDNVRPAGRSVTAENLQQLAGLTVSPELGQRAAAIFSNTPELIERAPHAFSRLLIALDRALDRSKEIALVGNPTSTPVRGWIDALEARFLPNKVIAAAAPAGEAAVPLLEGRPQKDSQPTAYVCENHVCKLPVTDEASLLELAESYRPLGETAQ
jgi:hypothetical protein